MRGVSVKVGRSAVGVVTTVSSVGVVVTAVSSEGGVVNTVSSVGGEVDGLLSKKVDIKFHQGWAGVYRN